MAQSKEIRVVIFEQVGGTAAVSSEDGDTVYKRIHEALSNKVRIMLDFNNIDLITSTFLNAAIGQLYNNYDSATLNKLLKIENMAGEDLALLKKVIERAKEYFRDREKVEKGIKEVLGDE